MTTSDADWKSAKNEFKFEVIWSSSAFAGLEQTWYSAMMSPTSNCHFQQAVNSDLSLSLSPLQDPLDPGRCVMVVRSLVPGGVAERHGGLLPGDQLVWVEQRQAEQLQVEQLSLAEAVQALKAVPPGPIHLGIRKPLV